MAINQIKVANEAKQDITISKTDQILGRLADQTVIAKTVKSVQRGVIEFTTQDNVIGGYHEVVAYISSVDMSKCDVFYSLAVELNSDVSVCLNSTTSSSLTFHVGKAPSSTTIYSGKVSWQVIEFY